MASNILRVVLLAMMYTIPFAMVALPHCHQKFPPVGQIFGKIGNETRFVLNEQDMDDGGMGTLFYSRDRKQCLNFMHIPKTAGTSVELAATRTNDGCSPIAWGAYYHDYGCNGAHPCAFTPKHDPYPGQAVCCAIGNAHAQCPAWHVPPALDEQIAQYYNNGCGTFCVVRDPVERMISEYLWTHNRLHPGSFNEACNVEDFEHWLNTNLDPRMDPYHGACHFLPQATFVGSPPNQYCQHVLHFSNFSQEFNALMTSFDIPVQMTEHAMAHPHCSLELPDKLRRNIENFYKEDCVREDFEPTRCGHT